MFKKHKKEEFQAQVEPNEITEIIEKNDIQVKPQQSFSLKVRVKKINKKTTTFRLPKIELLEQNSNRISLAETNKNKHSADFMEKYFLILV